MNNRACNAALCTRHQLYHTIRALRQTNGLRATYSWKEAPLTVQNVHLHKNTNKLGLGGMALSLQIISCISQHANVHASQHYWYFSEMKRMKETKSWTCLMLKGVIKCNKSWKTTRVLAQTGTLPSSGSMVHKTHGSDHVIVFGSRIRQFFWIS